MVAITRIEKTLKGFEKWLSKEKKTHVFKKGDITKKVEILNEFISPCKTISFSKKDGNPYFEITIKGGKTIKLFNLSKQIASHFLQACEKLKAA